MERDTAMNTLFETLYGGLPVDEVNVISVSNYGREFGKSHFTHYMIRDIIAQKLQDMDFTSLETRILKGRDATITETGEKDIYIIGAGNCGMYWVDDDYDYLGCELIDERPILHKKKRKDWWNEQSNKRKKGGWNK